jgi:2'-5' RNA ligase
MRSFISIELPENIKKEIFKTFESLKNSGYIYGNFVQKDNIHLTLKFLGNLSEEKIQEIQNKLSEIKLNSFGATTGEIGFFPSEKYIRVIWVDLVSDELKNLKKIIDDKLHEIGVNHDNREFSSHLTVARIKKVKDKENFLKKLKELKVKKMNFDVDSFFLIKSELRREGPVYKTIKKFDLE